MTSIKAGDIQSNALDLGEVFENEKGLRVSRLFELLKMQDELDCELVIAEGRNGDSSDSGDH